MGEFQYKRTESYLTTTVSVLKKRGSSGKFEKLAVTDDNLSVKQIISEIWPDAEMVLLDSNQECVSQIVDGSVDGALLKSYTAQELARNDIQNRLSVDIVPGAALSIEMGVNAKDDSRFYGLWEKALAEVSEKMGAEIVQTYIGETATPNILAYMFDHPVYLVVVILQDETGKERMTRQVDQMLYDREINEGDTVFFNERKELEKCVTVL